MSDAERRHVRLLNSSSDYLSQKTNPTIQEQEESIRGVEEWHDEMSHLENMGKRHSQEFSAGGPITVRGQLIPSFLRTAEPKTLASTTGAWSGTADVPRMRRANGALTSESCSLVGRGRRKLPLARRSPDRGFAYDCLHFLFFSFALLILERLTSSVFITESLRFYAHASNNSCLNSKTRRCIRQRLDLSQLHFYTSLSTLLPIMANKMANPAVDPEKEEQQYLNEVAAVKQWWTDSRWRYTKRPFTAEQIVAKRGNLKIEYPSNVQSKKLWNILEGRFKACARNHGFWGGS